LRPNSNVAQIVLKILNYDARNAKSGSLGFDFAVNQFHNEKLWKSYPGIKNIEVTIAYHLYENLRCFIGGVISQLNYFRQQIN
jgi:hypothetical protein